MSKRYDQDGTFVAIADTHGNCQHDEAVERFHDFCDDYQPKHRLMLGDAFDLCAMRAGAKESERAICLQPDLDAGWAFLERFKPTVMMLGNHDDRPWQWLKSPTAEKRHLAASLIDDWQARFLRLGTVVYPYDASTGVYTLGCVNWLHGYTAALYTPAKIAQHYAGGEIRAAVCGHVHRSGVHRFASWPRGTTGIALPSMCCRDKMGYIDKVVGKMAWDVGWMSGEVVNGVVADWRFHIIEREESEGVPLWK